MIKEEEAEASLSQGSGGVPPKGSFRRAKSRASRACEVCHARKVRCDVTVHMPCTNCAAFGCECKIPEVKQRKPKNNTKKKREDSINSSSTSSSKDNLPDNIIDKASISSRERTAALPQGSGKIESTSTKNKIGPSEERHTNEALSTNSNMPQYGISNEAAAANAKRLKSKKPLVEYASPDHWDYLLNSSVKGAGRVAFLGSTTNLNLLLEDHTESYHYSLPDDSSKSRLSEIEKEEVDILKIRGAFLLPSRELCDDIVESFFERVHPIIPIINRAQFMRQYNDPSNPPSLLLLQAILLAGSRVCRNPALQDASGSSELASLTFFKRAKALYDANYETDRLSIVQSTALLGWWWDNPEDLTKNAFHWTRIAVSIAQGFGMHRSVEDSTMSPSDKKMWKRIWWTLFVRDRYIALAMGRPFAIDLEDSDVPMITEEDLNENEPDKPPSPYPQNRVQNLCFIHSVKLAEIIGYILKQQFTVRAENSRRMNKTPNIAHCDMAMASWMKNLPDELKYSVGDRRNHDFFKGLLHSQYYTVLSLVHRSNIVFRSGSDNSGSGSTNSKTSGSYPSWGIAFQAAHMISMIMENMRAFNELREVPGSVVYNIFSSMITLLYQAESTSKVASDRAQKALESNLLSMQEVGKTWIVGRMICKLFAHLDNNPKIRQKIVQTAKKISSRDVNRTGDSNGKVGDSQNSQQDEAQKQKQKDLGVPNADEEVAPTSANPNKRRPTDDHGFEAPPAPKQRRNSSSASSVIVSPKDVKHHNSAKMSSARPNKTSPTGAITGSSPEFYFVTNTPPSAGTYIDNFQPSQLFPEVQDVNFHSGLSSSSVTPVDTNLHQTVSGSTPLDIYSSKSSTSPVGDGEAAPSTLNIGDWYQFLVTNTDGHLPDVSAMMSAFGDFGSGTGAPTTAEPSAGDGNSATDGQAS